MNNDWNSGSTLIGIEGFFDEYSHVMSNIGLETPEIVSIHV